MNVTTLLKVVKERAAGKNVINERVESCSIETVPRGGAANHTTSQCTPPLSKLALVIPVELFPYKQYVLCRVTTHGGMGGCTYNIKEIRTYFTGEKPVCFCLGVGNMFNLTSCIESTVAFWEKRLATFGDVWTTLVGRALSWMSFDSESRAVPRGDRDPSAIPIRIVRRQGYDAPNLV